MGLSGLSYLWGVVYMPQMYPIRWVFIYLFVIFGLVFVILFVRYVGGVSGVRGEEVVGVEDRFLRG